MFSALILTLAVGAPVPATPAPVQAGIAPRVMELKPDTDGKIILTVIRTEMQKVQGGVAILPANGVQPVPAPNAPAREITVRRQVNVELSEVKDLAITTADGKKVELADAMKKIAAGAIVVVSSDGQPVSPIYLKVFKDETLVLSSPELIASPIGIARPPIRTGPVRVLPPGAAGGGAAVPAQPAPVPVPAPVEK